MLWFVKDETHSALYKHTLTHSHSTHIHKYLHWHFFFIYVVLHDFNYKHWIFNLQMPPTRLLFLFMFKLQLPCSHYFDCNMKNQNCFDCTDKKCNNKCNTRVVIWPGTSQWSLRSVTSQWWGWCTSSLMVSLEAKAEIWILGRRFFLGEIIVNLLFFTHKALYASSTDIILSNVTFASTLSSGLTTEK